MPARIQEPVPEDTTRTGFKSETPKHHRFGVSDHSGLLPEGPLREDRDS